METTMENTIVLVGYPNNYKFTTAKNYYAYITNANAYTSLVAANKADAIETIRRYFPAFTVQDKAES